MANTNYASKEYGDDCARVYGRSLPISTKTSIEVCSFLRGKSVKSSISYLDEVLDLKKAIPFTRFNDGVGHRRGKMASGRFPRKASIEFQALLKSVQANAAAKGLSDDLKIIHLCAHKASTPMHQGRQRRRVMKRTHVELIVREQKDKSKKENKEAKS